MGNAIEVLCVQGARDSVRDHGGVIDSARAANRKEQWSGSTVAVDQDLVASGVLGLLPAVTLCWCRLAARGAGRRGHRGSARATATLRIQVPSTAVLFPVTSGLDSSATTSDAPAFPALAALAQLLVLTATPLPSACWAWCPTPPTRP